MTSPPYYPVVVGTPIDDPGFTASNAPVAQPTYPIVSQPGHLAAAYNPNQPQYSAVSYNPSQYPVTYAYHQGQNPQMMGSQPQPGYPNIISQPVVALEIQSEPALSTNQIILLAYARSVRWFSVIDVFILVIYVLTFFWLLVLLPLPILGYFSGYRLSRPLSVTYMVFIILMIVLRVLLMALFQYVVFIVLAMIAIIFEVFIFIRVVRFFKLMGIMPQHEVETCRLFIKNGRRSN